MGQFQEQPRPTTNNIAGYATGTSCNVVFGWSDPPKQMWMFMPNGTEQLQISVQDPPCLFHRWMQRVCFGFKWREAK